MGGITVKEILHHPAYRCKGFGKSAGRQVGKSATDPRSVAIGDKAG